MTPITPHPALAPGDVFSVDRPTGESPRTGEVLEVLGPPERPHYRVRWEDEHESLYYPTDGVRVLVHHEGGSSS